MHPTAAATQFQFPPDIRRRRPPGGALIHASTRFSRRILARLCGSWPPSHRDSGAGQPNSSGRWAGDGHFDVVWREAEPDSVVTWSGVPRLQLRAGVILTNPAHRSRAAISKHHISGGWGGGRDLPPGSLLSRGRHIPPGRRQPLFLPSKREESTHFPPPPGAPPTHRQTSKIGRRRPDPGRSQLHRVFIGAGAIEKRLPAGLSPPAWGGVTGRRWSGLMKIGEKWETEGGKRPRRIGAGMGG